MNEYYDQDAARVQIDELYKRRFRQSSDSDIVAVAEVKELDISFARVTYPPSVHVYASREGENAEVIMKVYGVMCGGILPPFIRPPRLKSLHSLRNLRQQIKLTGFGSLSFGQDVDALKELCDTLEKEVGVLDSDRLERLPYEGHPCLGAHARYFTDRNLVPYDRNIPFPHLIDPNRVLADLQPPSLIHGPDNCVEYCREVDDGKGEPSYRPMDPGMLKAGDVVEMAFVCVAATVRDKRHRLLLTLRAVTLISSELRRTSEERAMGNSPLAVGSLPLSVKRRRLYVDMDDPTPVNQKRFALSDGRMGTRDCHPHATGKQEERGVAVTNRDDRDNPEVEEQDGTAEQPPAHDMDVDNN